MLDGLTFIRLRVATLFRTRGLCDASPGRTASSGPAKASCVDAEAVRRPEMPLV